MNIEEVKRTNKITKNVSINLRTSEEVSKWMSENDVSPTLVFDNAIKELMQK